MLEDPTVAIERIYHEMYAQLTHVAAREAEKAVAQK